MKKNHRKRHPGAEPVTVEALPIAIDTCSLRFPDGSRWIFNLTLARQILRRDLRREIHHLSHDDLGRLIADQVSGRSFSKAEIDPLDHRIPGIAAVIDFGGQRRLNLIDGLERAVKAFSVQDGFRIYVLTDAERDEALWSKTGLAGFAKKILEG